MHQWQLDELIDHLIRFGAMSDAQLTKARAQAGLNQEKLPSILLGMEDVDHEVILFSMADIYRVPYIEVEDIKTDEKLLSHCSEELCKQYAFIPIAEDDKSITIVCGDPGNVAMLNALAFKLGKKIITRFSHPIRIQSRIHELYRMSGLNSLDDAIDGLDDDTAVTTVEADQESASLDELKRGAEESPIIKLVNGLIVQAMKAGSSDIHIEPGDRQSVVRLRVDGRLRPTMKFPARAHALVVSRIKIMSRLDISNTRIPQDGRARVKLWGKSYDMRISTLPSMHGEKVVIRILDKGGLALNLDALCFEELAHQRVREAIVQPTGAVLVTGPTGSGKTTTLYSFLQHIKNEEMNLITIEDPVEFQIDGVNQVQVNPKVGMTFASALRSILRQDPDVVMVGEIRDEETAEIALHAAQTGHLVFSTLHTNDAPSTITRLLDIGMEPTMLASSVNLIVSQRLVRRLCPKCRRQSKPSDDQRKRLAIPETTVLYDKVGCKECLDIGYKGRLGIHEVLYVTDRMRALIARGATDRELMQVAREEGMFTMFEDGMAKVLAGQTSLTEVMRVCTVPEGYQVRDHLDDQGGLLSLASLQKRRQLALLNKSEQSDKPLVLVVDDSGSVRTLVEFILDADGCRVIQAEDGQQAWEMLQRIQPNLVLTDYEMPNMDGMGLIRRMRELDRFDHVPIMMLTSRKSEEDEVFCLKAGADDYISKPVEPMRLQARVRRIMELFARFKSA